MLQFLRRLPGRTLRGALALLLVAAVALVAVTRTQVGRDALARRIETEFAQTFDGTLSIGGLTGNLLREFTATDITVRDSQGTTSLHVDTLLVRTSWEDLVRRRIVVPRIVALRPTVTAVVGDRAGIRIPGMTRRPAPGDSTGLLSFRSARLIVQGGVLRTLPPDSGRVMRVPAILADPAGIRVEEVELEVLLDWSETQRQLDLFRFQARSANPDVEIRSAETQILIEPGQVSVNRLRLALAQSRLSAEGSVSWSDDGLTALEASIDAPELSYDEVKRIAPGLRVSGRGAFGIRLTATSTGIAVSRVEVAAGESFLVASGTAVGMPDSVDFEVSIDRLSARSRDLAAFLPGRDVLRDASFDSLDASGYARGTAWIDGPRFDSLRADGSIVAGGDPGTLAGTFSVDLRNRSRPLLAVDAEMENLNLAAFVRAPSTRLTGRLELASEGLRPKTVTGSGRVELSGSRIGSRRLDHAVVRAVADGPALRFDLSMGSEADGWLRADGLWQRDEAGALSTNARWSRFDVSPLFGTDSLHTVASGSLDARFTGNDEATYAGVLTLSLDSTLVRAGGAESTALPQSLRIDVARADAPAPRIVVSGDALEAELSGDVRFEAVRTTLSFWAAAVAGAIGRELDKPFPGTARNPAVGLRENAREIRVSVLRGEAENGLAALGLDRPLELGLSATVHRPELLTGWVPGLPDLRGAMKVVAGVRADADSLQLSVTVSGDELLVAGSRLVDTRASLAASSSFDEQVERSLRLDSRLTADTLSAGPIRLPAIDASVSLERGRARISVRTGRHDEIGPVRILARYESMPERNRFVIDQMSIDARNYAWSLDRPSTLDLYDGGLTVDGLRMASDYSDLYGNQSLSVRGALSDLATDTLFVDADGVRLEEITRFASLKPDLGGRLDGGMAITRAGGHLLLVGDATATGLVLDGRLIGHVLASSRLVPGSPDVDVRLHITPADTAGFRWPEPPEEVRRNDLSIAGTVRLPDSGQDDPGAWNLEVTARRADLFFLRYIFNKDIDQVGGHLEGGGRITGIIRRPVFDLDFTVVDGRFRVPVTGVRYLLNGRVGMNRDAIVFPGVTVRNPGGGEALITGNLYFNEYQNFSFGLEAELSELLIIDTGPTEELPFYGTIRGSGTATLTGPLAAAQLRIADGVTRDDSELFIPIVESAAETDDSFIVFTDSTGSLPDLRRLARRPFLLARRASVERRFLDGLDLDINLFAPRGSIVHLVIDPLLGDVINAESTGRMQIRREQGEFEIFGTLEVEGGDYLFTAGEVFVRRFIIEEGGTITWESDPIDARLDIPAVYRTRASWAGLDVAGSSSSALVPLVVQLQITGRVLAPSVDLSLAVDRTNQNVLGDYQALEARLNNPERSAEYATSVLLTNSFQLTTETVDSRSGEQLAFNSVSQLVSAQLNRFLNAALPNVDVNVGLLGERASDLDITYGVALRLLDERLIIRGEGVYQGSRTDATSVASETMQGEVVVEVRLSPTVSVEVFFRREGDVFQSAELTNTTGAGLSYQTEFPTWRSLWDRLFGWITPDRSERPESDDAR